MPEIVAPIREQNFEPNLGTNAWAPNLGPKFGTNMWVPILGPKFGTRRWVPDLASKGVPTFGTQTYLTRVHVLVVSP